MAAELSNLFIFITDLFFEINTISNIVSITSSSRSVNKLLIYNILDIINNTQQYFGVFKKYLIALITDIQILSTQYNQNNRERF